MIHLSRFNCTVHYTFLKRFPSSKHVQFNIQRAAIFLLSALDAVVVLVIAAAAAFGLRFPALQPLLHLLHAVAVGPGAALVHYEAVFHDEQAI